MNAKHFLRNRTDRLRIEELFQKAVGHDIEGRSKPEMFDAIYRTIDYRTLAPEFHARTQEVLNRVASKSAEGWPR